VTGELRAPPARVGNRRGAAQRVPIPVPQPDRVDHRLFVADQPPRRPDRRRIPGAVASPLQRADLEDEVALDVVLQIGVALPGAAAGRRRTRLGRPGPARGHDGDLRPPGAGRVADRKAGQANWYRTVEVVVRHEHPEGGLDAECAQASGEPGQQLLTPRPKPVEGLRHTGILPQHPP